MVDPGQLLSDTTQNIAVLLLPPILWLFLYRFVWEEPAIARDVGFSRPAFWLLLLGGAVAVGTGANLPLLGYAGDLLAVNFGGALFPVILSGSVLHLTYRRDRGDADRALLAFLIGLVAASGAGFLEVLASLVSASGAWSVFVAPIGPALPVLLPMTFAVPSLILITFLGSSREPRAQLAARRAGLTLALAGGVCLLTYFTTAATAGVGISSAFPLYLIGPVAAGILAVLAMPSGFRLPLRFGLPVAYASSTFGVLIGADLFREPPLYQASGLTYSVGGAGPLDLVALSGPLAMAAGYLLYRALRRTDASNDAPAPVEDPEHLPPGRLLNRATDEYAAQRFPAAVADSARAARTAAEQARELLGVPPAPAASNPWNGLPVPNWIPADQENLDALAAAAPTDLREGYRGVQTSRWLVRLGRDLSAGRFASISRRTAAFGIDLGILTAVAVATFVGVIHLVGAANVARSLLFEAAVLGVASLGFVYFALAELFAGRTAGKQLTGLEVVVRDRAPLTLMAALVRNVPKLIPLTVLAFGLAVATALFLGAPLLPASTGGSPVTGALDLVGVVAVIATVVTIGLVGALSAVAIASSSERQRVGDLVAGTWVLNGPARGRPSVPIPVGAGAAPSG